MRASVVVKSHWLQDAINDPQHIENMILRTISQILSSFHLEINGRPALLQVNYGNGFRDV
jgi:hypothetical protein